MVNFPWAVTKLLLCRNIWVSSGGEREGRGQRGEDSPILGFVSNSCSAYVTYKN